MIEYLAIISKDALDHYHVPLEHDMNINSGEDCGLDGHAILCYYVKSYH